MVEAIQDQWVIVGAVILVVVSLIVWAVVSRR